MQLITKSIVKNRFHYIKNILFPQVVIADTTPKTSCTFNGQDSSVVVQSLKAVEDHVPTGPCAWLGRVDLTARILPLWFNPSKL
jgi:hypothetical protein